MSEYLLDPPLRLAGNVTVRTLDDAAAFARDYKTARQPMVRDGDLVGFACLAFHCCVHTSARLRIERL
jgi:hypothetical protein